MKLVKLLLISLFVWFNLTFANSQVKASFTENTLNGCGLTILQFNSTSVNADSIRWYLGINNITIKDSSSVSLTYPPGTYQVKLIAYNHLLSPSSDTSYAKINIYNPPKANFKVNRIKACLPDTANFTDLSVAGDGKINTWYWDFRDGTTNTSENPSHIYTSAGTYSVYLKITDSNQCISDTTILNYISVANDPIVSFNASPSGACTAPLNVQFANNSNGPGNLVYSWNFGDGDVSSLKSPSELYNKLGNYTVSLKVTSSDYLCSSSLSVASAVVIGNVVAKGTISQNSNIISNNGIICPGTINFSSTSSGVSSVLWIFGDTTSSSDVSGVHNYTYPGKYTISLVAYAGTSCSDTLKWNITVENVTAQFLEVPDNSCTGAPVIDTFKNQSINAAAYLWTFTDGSTSSAVNPTFTFIAPADTNPYAIHTTPYTYTTTLTVTSPHNCISTVSHNFSILRPTALFTIDTSQGCVPLKVTLTSTSISTSPVSLYRWQCGDGKDTTTLSDTYTHSYTKSGVYKARLIITNGLNCIDTSYFITIKSGNKPVPNFSVSPNPFCSSNYVQFTDLTPAGDDLNYWQYSIGGKSLPVIPMSANPLVKIHADTGKVSVTLLAGSNGCYATATSLITNTGPVDTIGYTFNCSAPLSYKFNAVSLGSTSFMWNFGDNTTRSDSLSLVHTFPGPGDYTVVFIAVNDGGSCSDSVIQIVKVRNSQASFTSPSKVCAGSSLSFIAAEASTDNECRDKYLWNFGDSTAMVLTGYDTIAHLFVKRGSFNVLLTSIFDNGCTDTVSKKIMVYQPYAKFTASKTSGCTPLPVKFTDQSTPDVNAIKSWKWNYGDGDAFTDTLSGDTHEEIFTNAGTFKVLLTVTDTMNCTDTVSDKISAASPSATFYVPNGQIYCSGTPVEFIYNFPNADSVHWTFGDGTTSDNPENPITHKYLPVNAFSMDTVSLVVYKNGCASPLEIQPDYITVQTANAAFQSDSVVECVSDQVNFKHLYPSAGMTGNWNFGDKTSSGTYITSPSHQYLSPGVYTVTLNIQTTAGCRDSFSRTITVKGPKGSFTLSKTDVCKSDTLTAELTDTSNVVSYEWVLGDGRTLNGNPLIFEYNKPEVVNFTLGLNGYNNCDIVIPSVTVNVDSLIASFSISDSVICALTSIKFNNLSYASSQQTWDLGDGTISTLVVPQPHVYNAGNYIITLYVTSAKGCKDTAEHSLLVNPLPSISISTNNKLCNNQELTLIANTNADSVVWNPPSGLNKSFQDTVIASPAKTTEYKINTVIKATKCSASDSIKVFKPYAVLSPVDTTVVIGDSNIVPVILKDSSGIGTFTWNPLAGLSCSNCLNPEITLPGVNNFYTLILKDPYGCFTDTLNVLIKVDTTHQAFALPKAFRPGSDGVNGIFKVRGRGIKQLLEFNIYNRYGNIVFSTTDLEQGWDGTYQWADSTCGCIYIYS